MFVDTDGMITRQLNDYLAERARAIEEAEEYIERHTKTCEECGETFVDPGFDLICDKCIERFYQENVYQQQRRSGLWNWILRQR